MSDQTAFDHLPRTPGNHFRLCFYAATYRVILHLYRLAKNAGDNPRHALEEHAFLGRYLEEMLAYQPEDLDWDEAVAWWGTQVRDWEADAHQELPLRELITSDLLSPAERDGLIVAGLIEEDSRFGTLFAQLQMPLSARRPTLELVDQVIGDGTP